MPEETFRCLIIVGLLLIMPPAAWFRIRSQWGGEKLDRLQEGWLILLGIRIPGLAHILGVILYAVDPAWMEWSQLRLPDLVRLLGVPLGALSGTLLLWTLSHLGKNLTDTVVVRRNARLVTSGPYRYVRHPFYLAGLLGMLANSLVTANWFIWLNAFTALVFIHRRTPMEEGRLLERFGEEYRLYQANTPRFIPKGANRQC